MYPKKDLTKENKTLINSKENLSFSELFLITCKAEQENGSADLLQGLFNQLTSKFKAEKSLASNFLKINSNKPHVYTAISYAIENKCSLTTKLLLNCGYPLKNSTEFNNDEEYYKFLIKNLDIDTLKDYFIKTYNTSNNNFYFISIFQLYNEIPIDNKYYELLKFILSKTSFIDGLILSFLTANDTNSKHLHKFLNLVQENDCKFDIVTVLTKFTNNPTDIKLFTTINGLKLIKALTKNSFIELNSKYNICNSLLAAYDIVKKKVASSEESLNQAFLKYTLDYIEFLIDNVIFECEQSFCPEFLPTLIELTNNYDLVTKVICKYNHLVNLPLQSGSTLLICILESYLNKYDTPDAKIANYYLKIANYIVDNCDNLNLTQVNLGKRNVLHLAAKSGDTKLYENIRKLNPDLENSLDLFKLKPTDYLKNSSISKIIEILIKFDKTSLPADITPKSIEQLNHHVINILKDEKFDLNSLTYSDSKYIIYELLNYNRDFHSTAINNILINIVNYCNSTQSENNTKSIFFKSYLTALAENLFNFDKQGNKLSVKQQNFLLIINQGIKGDNDLAIQKQNKAYLKFLKYALNIYENILTNIILTLKENREEFDEYKKNELYANHSIYKDNLERYFKILGISKSDYETSIFKVLSPKIKNNIFEMILRSKGELTPNDKSVVPLNTSSSLTKFKNFVLSTLKDERSVVEINETLTAKEGSEKFGKLDLFNSDSIQKLLKEIGVVKENQPAQEISSADEVNETLESEQFAKKRKVEKSNEETIKPGKEEVFNNNEAIQTQSPLNQLLIKAVREGDLVSVLKYVDNKANIFVRDEDNNDLIAIAHNGNYGQIESYLKFMQFEASKNNNNSNNDNNNKLKLNDLSSDDPDVNDQEYMDVVISTLTSLAGEGSNPADNV